MLYNLFFSVTGHHTTNFCFFQIHRTAILAFDAEMLEIKCNPKKRSLRPGKVTIPTFHLLSPLPSETLALLPQPVCSKYHITVFGSPQQESSLVCISINKANISYPLVSHLHSSLPSYKTTHKSEVKLTLPRSTQQRHNHKAQLKEYYYKMNILH